MQKSKHDQTGGTERGEPQASPGGQAPHAPPRDEREDRSESDIDRILAASFPASDPPPWTLGREEEEDDQD